MSSHAYHLSWEEEKYLKLMTLQVCLIGADGFVLASDTRAVIVGARETTRRYSTPKIFLNESESAAWCSSGGGICKKVCQELEKLLDAPHVSKPHPLDQINKCLREAVAKARESASEHEQRCGKGKILLVIYRDAEAVGFILQTDWVDSPEPHWDIAASDIFRDKMSSGDTGNASLLFPERYYAENKREEELVRIAAHTILMGHQVSRDFVDGLEIVAFRSRDSKFHVFDKEELASLRQFSSRLDNLLIEQFAAPL